MYCLQFVLDTSVFRIFNLQNEAYNIDQYCKFDSRKYCEFDLNCMHYNYINKKVDKIKQFLNKKIKIYNVFITRKHNLVLCLSINLIRFIYTFKKNKNINQFVETLDTSYSY